MERVDPQSASANFRCNLTPKNLDVLFQHMGWQVPGDSASLEKLDGKLRGGHFILTAKIDDELRLKLKSKNGEVDMDAEVDLEYSEISDFQCHRFEIEGRKKKGFRRELRFKATFPPKCPDALANLENY